MKNSFLLIGFFFLAACSSASPEPADPVDTLGPTATATIETAPTETATPTPTAQPTPIGGGGRIILNLPYELYSETHPDLGKGTSLFVYDVAQEDLEAWGVIGERYKSLLAESPEGQGILVAASDLPFDHGILSSLYYVDTANPFEPVMISDAYRWSYFGVSALWRTDEEVLFISYDRENFVDRVFSYRFDTGQSEALTPDNLNVRSLYNSIGPDMEFYWERGTGGRTRGNYVTLSDGETNEIATWIGDFSLADVSPDGLWLNYEERFVVSTRDGRTFALAEELEQQFGETYRGTKTYIGRILWTPSGGRAILFMYSGDEVDPYLSFAWNTSDNSFQMIPEEVIASSSLNLTWFPDEDRIFTIVTDTGIQEFSEEAIRASLESRRHCVYSISEDSIQSCFTPNPPGFISDIAPDGNSFLSFYRMAPPGIYSREGEWLADFAFPQVWIDLMREVLLSVSGRYSIESIWLD